MPQIIDGRIVLGADDVELLHAMETWAERARAARLIREQQSPQPESASDHGLLPA